MQGASGWCQGETLSNRRAAIERKLVSSYCFRGPSVIGIVDRFRNRTIK
jgi:hypothetical protein